MADIHLNKNMQTMRIFRIFALIVAVCSAASVTFGQKIFEVKYKSDADVVVFITKYKSEADLQVFVTKYQA